MALKKEIELNNGIITNYHRIVSLNKITNKSNVVEIASYTSKIKREEEKQALKEGEISKEAIPIDVYVNTSYINKAYSENETIQEVYDFLKTLEQFKDAEDV